MTTTFTRNRLVECPEPGILFTRDNAAWAYHALKAARDAGTSVPEQDELCDELASLLFPAAGPYQVTSSQPGWLAANREAERKTAAEIRRRELIREARGWIADCQWGDIGPDDVADLSDDEVIAGVNKFFEGGWAEFARNAEACRMDNPEPPVSYPDMIYVYDGDGGMVSAVLVLSQGQWADLCERQPSGYAVLASHPNLMRDRL
jgi:hypothetical protein